MIMDQTGALANVKRHDYLPFGEELFAPSGGRTTASATPAAMVCASSSLQKNGI